MAAREQGDAVADVRRDQMLAAAATLIAERGFSDTRIADVAERVGASPALVIYYFGTKDSLLTEALRWSERSFYAATEEMLRSTSSLRASGWRSSSSGRCVPDKQTDAHRRLGPVVRPVGAGVPPPRGQEGPGRARPRSGAT